MITSASVYIYIYIYILKIGFGAFFIILGCLYSSIENFDVKRFFSKTKI